MARRTQWSHIVQTFILPLLIFSRELTLFSMEVKLTVYSLQTFLFVQKAAPFFNRYLINYQALELLPGKRSSFISELSLSFFLFLRIGFNRTSLSNYLYPRNIDLIISESPNCWRNKALFHGPGK